MRSELPLRLALLGLLLAGCRAVEEPALAPGWSAAEAQRPLSHEDCVRLASEAAPTAAAWTARLDGARAALRQARALPNPSFEAGWEDFGVPWGSTSALLQETFSLAASLADLAARPRRSAAAEHELEAVRQDLLAERRALALSVSHAYDGLVASRERVALRRTLVGLAEDGLRGAEELVRSGLFPPLLVRRAETELAQARADLARDEAESRALELAFAFALGFERPTPLALAEPLSAPGPEAELDAEELLARAAEARPEIAAAEERYRAELERAHLAAGSTRFLPRVLVGARDTGGSPAGVATLDFELPLFDRGGAASDAEAAALLARAAELRRAARSVSEDVLGASRRLDAARRYLDEHALALEGHRRELRAALERLLPAGEASWEELVQARRDEALASLDRLAAQRELADAAVELRLAGAGR